MAKEIDPFGGQFSSIVVQIFFHWINPMMIHVFVSNVIHMIIGCCWASEKWYHIESGFPIRNPSGKIPEIIQEEESLVNDYR